MTRPIPAPLRLRLERVKRRLTQQQLADLVGCSQDWLSQLEKDNSARPSIALAERIHQEIGIPPSAWGDLRPYRRTA